MNRYLITATQVTNYELEVEADTPEQAMDFAEQAIDGWHETGSEFTVDYADEV